MFDKGKVLIGIAIFLVLILFPIWYGTASGGTGRPPDLDVGTDETICVKKDTAWMRANHMDLLDEWRDDVVRGEGPAWYVAHDNRRWEKSLTRTCMKCHTNYDGFCKKCHDYASVEPYCWECHNKPQPRVEED